MHRSLRVETMQAVEPEGCTYPRLPSMSMYQRSKITVDVFSALRLYSEEENSVLKCFQLLAHS